MKKVICSFLLFLAVGFLFNCTGISPVVKTYHDDFDNFTIDRLQDNLLATKTATRSLIYLNAQRFQQGNIIKYSLIIEYSANSLLFIKEGESLVLLVDDKRIGFTGEGSWDHKKRLYSHTVHEIAYYDTSPEIIRKIAFANEVRVKIIGDVIFEERYFDKYNFQYFQYFYNEYIAK